MPLKKNIFIFGLLENADMAFYYFQNDTENYNVVGFTADNPDINIFNNKPVIAYNDLKDKYKPNEIEIFAPISKNLSRYKIFNRIKSDGYNLPSYLSSKSLFWNKNAIGQNCFIQEFNNIQYGTNIGNNCIIWAGNHIGHHGKLDHSIQITSQVVISGRNNIEPFCYFGVNSSTIDGIKIHEKTILGMNSGLIKNTKSPGLYVGFPAKLVGSEKRYI